MVSFSLTRPARAVAGPPVRPRVLLVLLVAVLAVAAGSGLGNARTGQAAEIAYVATDGLNLRVEPWAGAAVIDVLGWGEDVKVVGGPTWDGWYEVVDQENQGWVAGEYLSFGGYAGAGGSSGGGSSGGRWIDIDRSSQTVTLYEGGSAVASYWAALGWDTSDSGYYATAVGSYSIYAMNAALAWSEPGQVYFTHWVAFDPDRANGFHSFSMDADGDVIAGGDSPTGGCVALAPWAAAAVYDFAEIGMTVEVHW